MDYWQQCDVRVWPSFDALQRESAGARFFYFSTKASRLYWEQEFADGDHLVFGRETRGLPDSLLAAHPGSCLRIPMEDGARSLNLATSAGIALYEGLRQVALAQT